jgi:hypothetical protein
MIEDCFPFATGAVSMTTLVHPELRLSQQIFKQILNGPYEILKRGLGETDS